MKSEPRPFMSVEPAGKMTLAGAKERAKAETGAHVIWLGLVTRADGMGGMYLTHIEYSVLVPGTGHVLFSGQLEPGKQQVVAQGGVMRIPRPPARRSMNLDMKQGAREVTYRLKSTGWLCWKVPC